MLTQGTETEELLTIARLILNQQTDISLIVWGVYQRPATCGMPTIVNFEERKMLKRVLEIRDQAINTATYIVDMNGHPHKICDSIGYGFPYSTQFTTLAKSAEDRCAFPGRAERAVQPVIVGGNLDQLCRSGQQAYTGRICRTSSDRQPVSAVRKQRLELGECQLDWVQVDRAAALRGGDGDFRLDPG
jgi:hypothetical protein